MSLFQPRLSRFLLPFCLLLLTSQTVSAAIISSGTSDTERAGDLIMLALPLTGLAMTYANDDSAGRTQLLKSAFTTAAITSIVKVVVNKERPNGGDYSFPSGHSSAAFAGASFIQTRYGWQWGAPAYAAATFVAWSRVDANKHYVEDVLAGAALALLVNRRFVTPKLGKIALNVLPVIGGGYQLNASLHW
ncbi:MAG: phosphatase PAP2 family protein [Gammaproteobacteria bacterium]|nr:phosphatase PAP2 family protein [Gammaproteobacteria bacterium]